MNKKTFFLSAFLTLLAAQGLFAQGRNYLSGHKGPFEPPFKKIYIQPSQLVTLPDGVYYYDEEGKFSKARTVLSDCDGMYVISISQQCSLCGRCNEGTFLDEEYGCPHFQRKVSSNLWVD